MDTINSNTLCLQDLVSSNSANTALINLSNGATSSINLGNDSCSSNEHSANDQKINFSLSLHPSQLNMHHNRGSMAANLNQNQHRTLSSQSSVHYQTAHNVNSLISNFPSSNSSSSPSHHFYNNHHLHHYHHHHGFQTPTLGNSDSRIGSHLENNNSLLNPSLDSTSCASSIENDSKKLSGKFIIFFFFQKQIYLKINQLT